MSRETVGGEVRSGDLTVEGTVKTPAVNHPDATDGGLAISSTGAVSGGLPVPNRNLLYNGAMQVAQRGTSVAGITSGGNSYNTADRWITWTPSSSVWTQSVEADAPSGFASSLKMLCTTADASPSASERTQISQNLEGQDLQRIAVGTADAKELTLSFWVKSNVTGTFTVWLYSVDSGRAVSAAYTISSSATWEYKTVTLPADSAGTFNNDNGNALEVVFGLVAGSDYSSGTLGTSWGSAVTANLMVGQTNLASAVNNYWQVTGVQLETGPVATEFEHRSFGDELARCQRYFQIVGQQMSGAAEGTTAIGGTGSFITAMRAAPSLTTNGNSANFRHGGLDVATSSPVIIAANTMPETFWVLVSGFTGLVSNYPVSSRNQTNIGFINASAEL